MDPILCTGFSNTRRPEDTDGPEAGRAYGLITSVFAIVSEALAATQPDPLPAIDTRDHADSIGPE